MTARLILGVLAGAFAFSTTNFAATAGSDSADQQAYAKGWSSGDNGGTGFKGWNLVSSDTKGACGFFIGDSKKLSAGSGGDVNSGGKAFGMFAHGDGKSAEAYRSFDTPLSVGQSFTVELAVNFRNGNKGLDLRSAGDEKTIFNLNVGADDYVINSAATGNGSMSTDYNANTVMKVTIKQTSDKGGEWSVSRTGGLTQAAKGTYTGVAGGVKLYSISTQEGSENDLYVNRLTIAGQ